MMAAPVVIAEPVALGVQRHENRLISPFPKQSPRSAQTGARGCVILGMPIVGIASKRPLSAPSSLVPDVQSDAASASAAVPVGANERAAAAALAVGSGVGPVDLATERGRRRPRSRG